MKGRLAQLVQSICLTSRGSAVRIRQRPPFINKKHFGRLAQLVQSICLTSRGSAVRIRQRPQKESSFTLLFLFPPPQTIQLYYLISEVLTFALGLASEIDRDLLSQPTKETVSAFIKENNM